MSTEGVMAVLQVTQGIQKSQAMRAEAERIDEQAAIGLRENHVAQDHMRESNRHFEEKQSLAYLKNGVSLEGSPLLVLEDTFQKGQEEVAAVGRSGRARFNLLTAKGEQLRRGADAEFTGALVSAAGSTFKAKSEKTTTTTSESNTLLSVPSVGKKKNVPLSRENTNLNHSGGFWSRTKFA